MELRQSQFHRNSTGRPICHGSWNSYFSVPVCLLGPFRRSYIQGVETRSFQLIQLSSSAAPIPRALLVDCNISGATTTRRRWSRAVLSSQFVKSCENATLMCSSARWKMLNALSTLRTGGQGAPYYFQIMVRLLIYAGLCAPWSRTVPYKFFLFLCPYSWKMLFFCGNSGVYQENERAWVQSNIFL